jgi:hypothetical protein
MPGCLSVLNEKKGKFAGDIATPVGVQIPPRPPQTKPARSYEISFKGSLSFSEDLVASVVADEFESCFYELVGFLF